MNSKHKEYIVSKSNKQPGSHFKLHRWFLSKKWLVIGIIVLLFFAGVAGVWLFISNQVSLSSSKNQQISKEAIAQQTKKNNQLIDSTETDVQNSIDSGSKVTDTAIIYDKAVGQTEDAKTKAYILLNKSVMYSNDKMYDEALSAALESEAADKNPNIEKLIAEIYEMKNDNKKAIEYYQKAISLVDKSQPLSNSDIQDYQNRIQFLSGASN